VRFTRSATSTLPRCRCFEKTRRSTGSRSNLGVPSLDRQVGKRLFTLRTTISARAIGPRGPAGLASPVMLRTVMAGPARGRRTRFRRSTACRGACDEAGASQSSVGPLLDDPAALRTTMRLAYFAVERRWAMTSVVRPASGFASAARRSRPRTPCPAGRWLVGSGWGRLVDRRAIASRWRPRRGACPLPRACRSLGQPLDELVGTGGTRAARGPLLGGDACP
jgi:hypothetical protein